MKLWNIIFTLFYGTNSLMLKNNFINKNSIASKTILFSEKQPTITKLVKKTSSFFRLIRANNILPTCVLSFTGGWIVHPHTSLFKNKAFWASGIITTLILSSSMIMNDLDDIELDKKNNPTRPLVTGEITKKEAIISNAILLSFSYILSFAYLKPQLHCFTHLVIFLTSIYTPVLKKITYIKNITCAFLVSFSTLYSGIATLQNSGAIYKNTQIYLLFIVSQLLFYGSYYKEILLDVCDIDGDYKNNIITVPVVYGKEYAWKLAYTICNFNILWNVVCLTYITNFKYGIMLLFLYNPLIQHLEEIKNDRSTKNIMKQLNKINGPMTLCLLYLCFIAKRVLLSS